MPYPKKYKVIGPVVIFGAKAGETFTLETPPMWKHNPSVLAVSEQAWIDGGLVELVEEGKLKCPACQETGAAKQKKLEYTPSELVDHYTEAHPGLEPPREG